MKKILLFCVVVLIFGCKQNAEVDEIASADAIMSVSLPPNESSYDKKEVENNVSEPAFEKLEKQIIKTGDLRFETNDIEETFKSIQSLAKKYNVIIQNDSQGKDGYSVYRNLNLRIKNENFDAFINDISKGVDYFERKNISIDDVTEEYIDILSRIKTKKALESRYLELLNKANKVSEMLEIEKQLTIIREEIESKEGRLKYIQNQVSLSTISLEFYKTLEHKEDATVSFGSKFVNAIKSGFNGISIFFIWLVEIWPFIVILVAIFYFIRKRIKKKQP